MLWECFKLFYTFAKIGFLGFGGGYAMLSVIMQEAAQFSVTPELFADLTALDMIVPGPIAINAATYVGYFGAGVLGSLSATVGVAVPSFIIVTVFMRINSRSGVSRVISDLLTGIKPAAVGLISATAVTIAAGVAVNAGYKPSDIFINPLGAVSAVLLCVFAVTAVGNIKFKINPILLTLLAGVFGAVFVR